MENLCKKRTIPKDPETDKQVEIRKAFGEVVKNWKEFGGAVQKLWYEVAKKQRRDRGYDLFISVNVVRQRVGESLLLWP